MMSRRSSGFDRRAHRGIVSGAYMQTPNRVRAAMNWPTRSEHRHANIAATTICDLRTTARDAA